MAKEEREKRSEISARVVFMRQFYDCTDEAANAGFLSMPSKKEMARITPGHRVVNVLIVLVTATERTIKFHFDTSHKDL